MTNKYRPGDFVRWMNGFNKTFYVAAASPTGRAIDEAMKRFRADQGY
jgi:hypothetical protein